MAPVSGTPRELLWYHQIQRENRHILERMNKQQADIDKIKSQLAVSQAQGEQAQQVLSELEAKEVTATERRREDFEREKDILKRIGELEDSIQALRKANDNQVVATGTASQWQALEQRLDIIENHHTTACDQDMQRIKLRMDDLERGMPCAARHLAGSANQLTEENVSDPVPEANLSVPEGPAANQSGGGKAKQTGIEEPQSEHESIERPAVQQRRRLGRERIPFRPTPPDMVW